MSSPLGPVASLKDSYFDAGKDLTVTGDQITVYLRARDPRGQWTYALFSKRGSLETVALPFRAPDAFAKLTEPFALRARDAILALISLGYKQADAQQRVRETLPRLKPGATVEDVVRTALAS